MTNHDHAEDSFANKPSRRRVVSTVAWTAPVIATAGLAPFAAASAPAGLTVNWTSQYTESLVSADLNARALALGVSADAAILTNTWPTTLTFTNSTANAYNGPLTATVEVNPSAGIRVDLLGSSRLTVKGVDAPNAAAPTPVVSAATATAGGGTSVTIDFGTSIVPANGTLVFPVTFGYTNPGLSLSLALLSGYTASISAVAETPTVVDSGANGVIRHYLAALAVVPSVLTVGVTP